MRLTILLVTAAMLTSAQNLPITVKVEDERVHLTLQGKPYTDFYIKGRETTKPYLWPLRAPSGTEVTRQFPMATAPNEPHDHPHHRGIWFAHEKVNGVDFWNNDISYTAPPPRGRIVFEKITKAQSGKVATVAANFAWNDPDGKKLVEEARTMQFSATKNLRIIDVSIVLTAAVPVTFADAKDGTLGIRLNPQLQEDKKVKPEETNKTVKSDAPPVVIPGPPGVITNAEGVHTEKLAWGKRSDWVDYSGEINGEKVGIAILDDPANSRRARWHVRAYGLFAANPFGDQVFTNDKTHDGSVSLTPGQLIHFRYRVIIHPGDAGTADIAKQWEDFIRTKHHS